MKIFFSKDGETKTVRVVTWAEMMWVILGIAIWLILGWWPISPN